MSDNSVSLPLADIIKRAAALQVSGPAAQVQARIQGASKERVVLVDVSSSMTSIVSLNLSRYEHCRLALADVLKSDPGIRIIAFGSQVREIADPQHPPLPCGGTPLHEALKLAATYKPVKTVVITDGEPDDADAALAAADKVTGQVDTIFCGADTHAPAIAFLRKLARATGGEAIEWTGNRELAGTIRRMLPAPEV